MADFFDGDSLWVLVRAQNSMFALDSACVESISLLEEDVTPTPDSDAVHVGIVQFRGSVLPVLDLRGLLGMPSMATELTELQAMMDTRKHDHIHWVDELRRCAHEHAPFGLATDPHSCAFGQWFYNYQPKNQSVGFHLKRIEEPHRKLHETAIRVLERSNKRDDDGALEILTHETEVYMSQVMSLLDETKVAFGEGVRKIMIVISSEGRSCGVLLDEVLAVETLEPLESDSIDFRGRLVSCPARRRGTETLVLPLDTAHLLGYSQQA